MRQKSNRLHGILVFLSIQYLYSTTNAFIPFFNFFLLLLKKQSILRAWMSCVLLKLRIAGNIHYLTISNSPIAISPSLVSSMKFWYCWSIWERNKITSKTEEQ